MRPFPNSNLERETRKKRKKGNEKKKRKENTQSKSGLREHKKDSP
jgi:hypothetical protein